MSEVPPLNLSSISSVDDFSLELERYFKAKYSKRYSFVLGAVESQYESLVPMIACAMFEQDGISFLSDSIHQLPSEVKNDLMADLEEVRICLSHWLRIVE